jgi:phospholipase/carboxylesterase
VRVPSEAELITFQDWTLRLRPATQGSGRLLLLIHGFTGDENSMWVFVRNFPPQYVMLAPRALHPTQPSGYSWRIAQPSAQDRPGLENLKPAAAALIALVDAYARQHKLEAAAFDVMGFSQGAVLAASLALLYPERVGRAAILSGFVPEHAESLLAEGRLRSQRFFVAHGQLDETLPIALARASVQALEAAGAEVTFCQEAVGHKVGLRCLRALEEFFARP